MTGVIASPSVRALAGRRGIDIDRLAAELGRTTIAREDLERRGPPPAQQGTAAPGPAPPSPWDVDHAAYGPVRFEQTSRIARVAAANLGAANAEIPQVTHHDRADMRAVEAFRARMKPQAESRGLRLTALAFHVAALARCLIEFPRLNASLEPGGTRLVLKDYVHVAIAVDTPGGLLVPVIRNADRKGLWDIAADIADLAARAQARKLRAEDMGGASITISNLGGIGGHAFTPIVNPPELAILGLAKTELQPVWTNDSFHPVPMTPISLSYDHRVINGADAARTTKRLADMIKDPRYLMV